MMFIQLTLAHTEAAPIWVWFCEGMAIYTARDGTTCIETEKRTIYVQESAESVMGMWEAFRLAHRGLSE